MVNKNITNEITKIPVQRQESYQNAENLTFSSQTLPLLVSKTTAAAFQIFHNDIASILLFLITQANLLIK